MYYFRAGVVLEFQTTGCPNSPETNGDKLLVNGATTPIYPGCGH